MTPDDFMNRAVEIAATAENEPGALPYGAVVVLDGKIVGEGLNRAKAAHDPTSHGEVEAIRDACRRLETTNLEGAVMYTTAEPCAMCVATMLLAGFGSLVYAYDADQSSAFIGPLAARDPSLKRRYFAAELRRQVGLPADARDLKARRAGIAAARRVFQTFAARALKS